MSVKRVLAIAIAATVLGFMLGSFGIAGAVGGSPAATQAAAPCGSACATCPTPQAATAGAVDCANCPTPGQCDTCTNQGACGSEACPTTPAQAGGECGSGACGDCQQ